MSTNDKENGGLFSLSPLAHKTTLKSPPKSQRKSSLVPKAIIEERPFIPDPSPLPSDTEEALETEREDNDGVSSIASSSITESNSDDEEGTTEGDDDVYVDSDEGDGDWEEPLSSKTPKAKRKAAVSISPTIFPETNSTATRSTRKTSTATKVSKLIKNLDDLQIGGKKANDTAIVLSKKYKASSNFSMTENERDGDGDDSYDLPVIKKKKRSVLGIFLFL